MIWLGNDIKAVLWIAVVPAFLAIFLLVAALREPMPARQAADPRRILAISKVSRLPLRYWLVVTLGAAFTLARFSEAFLILRAQDVGLTLSFIPGIMVVMNIILLAFFHRQMTSSPVGTYPK